MLSNKIALVEIRKDAVADSREAHASPYPPTMSGIVCLGEVLASGCNLQQLS